MNRQDNAGRQGTTMQRRLQVYWVFLIGAFLGILSVLLVLAGVFSNQEQKIRDALSIQLDNSGSLSTRYLDTITANYVDLSGLISRDLTEYLGPKGMKVRDLNDRPEELKIIQTMLYNRLDTAIRISSGSGGYIFLNATTNSALPGSEDFRTGMYLRYANLSSVSGLASDMTYFRGIPDIARANRIQLHNRWNLEFDLKAFPEFRSVPEELNGRLAASTFWTEQRRLTDTWEDVTLLCVPVLDATGMVCGFCGAEISSLLFYLTIPPAEGDYGPVYTGLVKARDGVPVTGRVLMTNMEGGSSTELSLSSVRPGKYFTTYEIGETSYIGLHEVIDAKDVEGDSYAVVVFQPEAEFRLRAAAYRNRLIAGLVLFAGVMLLLSFWLSHRFVSPIITNLRALREDNLPAGKSGISEIDELMEYFRGRAESENGEESTLPPEIEALFTEFAGRVKSLTAAERGIFDYYMEGLDAQEIADRAFISMSTVRKHSGNIYRKLGVASRDELMLYIDLFRRSGRLDELKN